MYAYSTREKVLNFLLFGGFLLLFVLTPFARVIDQIVGSLLLWCDSWGCLLPYIVLKILCTFVFAVIGVWIAKELGKYVYAAA